MEQRRCSILIDRGPSTSDSCCAAYSKHQLSTSAYSRVHVFLRCRRTFMSASSETDHAKARPVIWLSLTGILVVCLAGVVEVFGGEWLRMTGSASSRSRSSVPDRPLDRRGNKLEGFFPFAKAGDRVQEGYTGNPHMDAAREALHRRDFDEMRRHLNQAFNEVEAEIRRINEEETRST